MHKWRVGLIGSLILLSLALAACWLAQGGRATPEGSDKGEELESLAGGFEWRRVGGIAGFCDVVTVRGETAVVASCRREPAEVVGEVTLTADQSRQVADWVDSLRSFEEVQSDGAVADGLTITLTFTGLGDAAPTDSLLNDLAALVNEIMVATRED
ncbi:MAG: hypothetical protein KBF17_13965 [Candidatus Promineofilum sp.]|nr:hypothetical protein [Promineifilum sp.]